MSTVSNVSAPEILRYLRAQLPVMLELLQRLVLTESPSTVPASQKAVLTPLADVLAQARYAVRLLPGRQSGGHVYARPRQRGRRQPFQLLLGHCDTVWPLGTLKEMPLEMGAGVLHGPGVYDMKAGLVQVVYALRALHELGLEPAVSPVVFINSDEEVGSQESTPHIRRLARAADRAFVFEPSLGLDGKLKTARKGVGSFTVTVKGKAAHAGLDPDAGTSAILELSYIIQKLFALNNPARGVSVNVGVIDGGVRPNVIAPESRAMVDVRVRTQEEARRIEESIHNLRPTTSGITLEIQGRIRRPPLERTPRNLQLWETARQAGRMLDLDLAEGAAGGASDGNTTSLYTATLDGLGAVGDGAHARHEFIYVDKIVERCALLVLLLMAPEMKAVQP
jgi:glutamate carboxypeptidase